MKKLILLLSVILLFSCGKSEDEIQIAIEKQKDSIERVKSLEEDKQTIFKSDSIEVIVVQCANGYEYVMHGFDFNHVIEIELNKFEIIKVKLFPLKTLMGVAYQGVFDKKYCPPIIEKVDADYLILTRFDKEYTKTIDAEPKWGYELRIINTETLKQIESINAHDLKSFEKIKQHIVDHIETLKTDIVSLEKFIKDSNE